MVGALCTRSSERLAGSPGPDLLRIPSSRKEDIHERTTGAASEGRCHSFPALARPREKLSPVRARGINRVPAMYIPRQRRE